jgi:hypothetical protein
MVIKGGDALLFLIKFPNNLNLKISKIMKMTDFEPKNTL